MKEVIHRGLYREKEGREILCVLRARKGEKVVVETKDMAEIHECMYKR